MNGLCKVDTKTEFVIAHFGLIKIKGKSSKDTITTFFKVTSDEELDVLWFAEEKVEELLFRENRESIKLKFEKDFFLWLKVNPLKNLCWDGSVMDVETIYVYQNVIDLASKRRKKLA